VPCRLSDRGKDGLPSKPTSGLWVPAFADGNDPDLNPGGLENGIPARAIAQASRKAGRSLVLTSINSRGESGDGLRLAPLFFFLFLFSLNEADLCGRRFRSRKDRRNPGDVRGLADASNSDSAWQVAWMIIVKPRFELVRHHQAPRRRGLGSWAWVPAGREQKTVGMTAQAGLDGSEAENMESPRAELHRPRDRHRRRAM